MFTGSTDWVYKYVPIYIDWIITIVLMIREQPIDLSYFPMKWFRNISKGSDIYLVFGTIMPFLMCY